MVMTQKQKILLTQQGLRELKKEYQQLICKKRPAVVKKIQTARSLGDLSENAAYQEARKEQSFIEGRILELEDILSRAEIVKIEKDGKIQIGSKVKLLGDNDLIRYLIVDENEADVSSGKISHTSPLGVALLGKRAGEKIEVDVPEGKVYYKVIEVI